MWLRQPLNLTSIQYVQYNKSATQGRHGPHTVAQDSSNNQV